MDARPSTSPQEVASHATTLDLPQEDRPWEAERQREMERLHEEAGRLVEAWQRVEAEQRKLLAERESIRAQSRVTRSRSAGSEPEGDPEETVYACARRHAGEPAWETAIDDEPLTPEMAAMQFQQLRREIQKHPRRHR